ncbi:hypothetical protein [Permianibacter aggregans]|nr:hypothetical protein [Permianibacter aggregans]QGX39856.1 hypothetical protein E2H98_09375 [Permianibacter aggregans]
METAQSREYEESANALHSTLLQMQATALIKHAGKSGYRWAWQFVQDLELEADVQLLLDRYVVIRFVKRRISFRYLGGGAEGLIADTQIANIEKYQVAAVLAYQRANGISLVEPEPSRKSQNEKLDFGKDHALAEDAETSQSLSRQRLREAVRQLLTECVQLGLSHLSSSVLERFSTLAVWAQAADHYRLARLLRHVADHVEQLLARATGADEQRLFDDLTYIYGLVEALDSAEQKGLSPQRLLGLARNRYDTFNSLILLGIGALSWRSASGYRGLTMLFWSPEEQSFYSCTDARPDAQRGFNPRARYKAAGPWRGLSAPADACGRQLLLNGAQVSTNGRLSTTETTTAVVQTLPNARHFLDQFSTCSRWDELKERFSLARQSLLAEPQPMKDWVALKPDRFGAGYFDPVRQLLTWPLYDHDNTELRAEIPYSDDNQHAIERVESLADDTLPSGTVLIAKVRRSGSELIVEPLSLINPNSANPVDALHFDEAPKLGVMTKTIQRLKRITTKRGETGLAPELMTSYTAALEAARHALQRMAERGVTESSSRQVLSELSRHLEKLANIGFIEFQKLKIDIPQTAERLIRSHYVLLQYRNLLGEAPSDPMQERGDSPFTG